MTVETLLNQINENHEMDLLCVAGKEGLVKEIRGVYVGDLLSLVMAHAHEGELWLTVQGHMNAVAVASLVNIPAIIFVQGVQPSEEMIQKANEEQIVLLITHERSYELIKGISKYI